MLSPTMTVVVLAVLWLIVVVPMVFQRRDASSRERSVSRFRQGMQALGRRPVAEAEDDQATHVLPRLNSEGAELFVHGAGRAVDDLAPVTRRPVPAAEEALMYPVDRDEMSDARRQMMARRRRSLITLVGGSAVTVLLALIVGGLAWLLALAFLGGLGGYTYFLRNQALHDRERRASRQLRAVSQRRARTVASPQFEPAPGVGGRPDETIVRIDDDDIELHNMDTVDLTGLYQAELEHRERRAG
jgi:hypothetical protein